MNSKGVFVKEHEPESKKETSVRKVIQSASLPQTTEQLHVMSTDELVKMLMSPELAKPVNAALRQQIINILMGREGNAFVQRLLGKTQGQKG